MSEWIWLPEFRRYARIIARHAHFVVAAWTEEGQRFEIEITNDELDEITNDDDDD